MDKTKHMCRIINTKQKHELATLLKGHVCYSIDKLVGQNRFQFVGAFTSEKYTEIAKFLDSLEWEF